MSWVNYAWGEAVDNEAASESSEAEEDDGMRLGALSAGNKRLRAEGEDGLAAIL